MVGLVYTGVLDGYCLLSDGRLPLYTCVFLHRLNEFPHVMRLATPDQSELLHGIRFTRRHKEYTQCTNSS